MPLVLDTNVVLDLLVFRPASIEGLRQAIDQQRVTIVTHAGAIDELRRVLAYPQCKLAADQQARLLASYRAWSQDAAMPQGYTLENLLLPDGFPRCRDRDDQQFLALAYHTRAECLLTKDKQLLRLKKRAAKFGVTIFPPQAFPPVSSH